MQNNQVSIKQLLHKCLNYWYLFVAIPPLLLAGAYFYLKMAIPTYQSEAMILIKDDENSGAPTEEIVFTELGMGKKNKTLENETVIMKSSPLLTEVVKRLQLQYQYISIEGLKKRPMYKNSPVQVLAWKPANENATLDGVLIDNGRGGYQLEIGKEKFNGEFGKELQLPEGMLTMSHKPGQFANFPVAISIAPMLDIAFGIADNLKVEIMGDLSSTLHLTLKDIDPERTRDILKTLLEVYNENSIAVKNKAYENTINMVNQRIELMQGSLAESETDYEAFKRNNQFFDLSAKGNLIMNNLATSDKELAEKQAKLMIVSDMEDFLTKHKSDFEFVPSNINLNDLELSNRLTNFNALLGSREKMRKDLGSSHPDLVLAETQINNEREGILKSVRTIKNNLEVETQSSANYRADLAGQLSSLPHRERQLLEIEREKSLRENLYLFLLQKREEAAVSLAVTAAKGRVIEPPQAVYSAISPKRSQIWLIALFLALAIPIGIIFFVESLNDKVRTEQDILAATEVPIAGTLGLSRKKDHVIVTDNSRSPVAEMFRLLRANLAFIIPGQELRTLIVTSSTSGEGKSFIAINMGMTMALAGKKTLILELDLRKPKQEQYMGVERSHEGVVHYLINPALQPFQIIRNTNLHPNLDLISSGPIPPNPGELIMSQRLRELIDRLRAQYDFIILDAPPVGRVADALQMRDLAEATMYVVRTNYTQKRQLEIVEDIAQKGKMPRPFIVLNGIPLNKPGAAGSFAYGYGYGYGKGYGYYDEGNGKKVKKQKPGAKQQPVKQA